MIRNIADAAIALADYALELREAGRAVEAADRHRERRWRAGETASGTIREILARKHDEMIQEFDRLALAYARSKAEEG